MRLKALFTRNSLWFLLVFAWLLLLSGAFARWFGSPGFWQARNLTLLLKDKKHTRTLLEAEVESLKKEEHLLRTNAASQEKAVRSVLGYVAPDELVFDFSRVPDIQ